ncbi:hypothetical protein F0231_06185 [Vibrio sp. RE86]|uniref:hypothetical protein n=1 Tax=Vibrio sp. RE86 TaxID=2607605 RepID=UPI00149378CA|nr:hypothetical protein [Vibrio sp. RE86]NOH79328.1 hypothetical protein [Vibrio sp. RE86]
MYIRIFITFFTLLMAQNSIAGEAKEVVDKKDTMQVHANKMESKIDQYIKYNEEIEKIRSEKAKLQEYLSLVKLKISVADEERKLKEKTQPKPKPLPVSEERSNTPTRPLAPRRKDTVPEVNIMSFAEVGNRINGVVMMDGVKYSLNKKITRAGKYTFKYGSGKLVVSTKDDTREIYVE